MKPHMNKYRMSEGTDQGAMEGADTSFTDFLFNLVLTLMIALTTSTQLNGIGVVLPKAGSAKRIEPSDERPVVLSSDETGAIYFEEKRTSIENAQRALAAMKKHRPNLKVVIEVSEDSRWGSGVALLDAVREASIGDVILETSKKSLGEQE